MKILQISLFTLIGLLLSCQGKTQGPSISYFYENNVSLPWASASVSFSSGSGFPIKFFPVIAANIKRAPYGTFNYTRDVSVTGKMVFLGDISDLSKNAPSVQLRGKIVLVCYDTPLKDKGKSTKALLIDAFNRLSRDSVKAMLFYPYNTSYPRITVNEDSLPANEVPVVTLNKSTADQILRSSGYDTDDLYKEWATGKSPELKELLTTIDLTFKGKFEIVGNEDLQLYYLKDVVSGELVGKLFKNNEAAIVFLKQLFAPLKPKWEKLQVVYFADYDDKYFYTRHMGSGLATGNGVFIVLEGSEPDFGLAVHEFTHILFNRCWCGNSSFFMEGVARYAQAMATDKQRNHRETKNYLLKHELIPIESLLELNIGGDPKYTDMGYSASGSFIGYLIERYGQPLFLKKWKTEDGWQDIYGKSLAEIEKDWHKWLTETTF